MQKVIISDTSCLILLDKVGELDLLSRVFGTIKITRIIAEEFKKELPDWFIIEEPTNKIYQRILEASLDRGEASAIALALEQNKCLLIMDDLKGRNYAEELGLKITGTLGILIEAKRIGELKSIRNILLKIKNTDFRISPELENRILELSGEI